ncbi:RNA polymerase sigma-70 factor [Arcticibacter eurypsychrophilus]|uniref:RNA polymerase sigma-70 factor n=1 Tax=Arcticibacter eurypsychrophilus TaxID=1434752 RepID=UPI00084D0C85|nr:RNA polymerase sigma-70 factor [Arcticibacter eurypsychrophilus]
MEITPKTNIELIKEGNEIAFEQVFKEHFKQLHSYAFSFLRDEIMAEEIVQNVFCKIWENRDQLKLNSSLKSYLYRSIHNESLNYIKHHKVKAAYELYYINHVEEGYHHTEEKVMVSELEKHISLALLTLPQQCRTIFQLSRNDQYKYREIATHLNISIKTVENQMGKALKILKTKLVEFLPALLLFMVKYFGVLACERSWYER